MYVVPVGVCVMPLGETLNWSCRTGVHIRGTPSVCVGGAALGSVIRPHGCPPPMVFEVKPIVFEAALSSHSSVRRCAGQHAAKAAALTLGNPLESADEAPASIGVQLEEDRYVETQQKDAQTHETTLATHAKRLRR